MASGKIGSLYVELDLDPSRYMRSQRTLLKEAKNGASILEKNFKNLGIKSGAMYDLMRSQAEKSFQAIVNSGKATANDILRAEKAKTDQLKRLQNEQYGHSKSVVDGIKGHWVAAAASIYAAWALVGKGFREATDIFKSGMQADQMKKAFSEIAGGAQSAKEEMDFLRQTSDSLGQNFWNLADSYKGILAASKASNITVQQTRDIFESVTKASATLGLSSEKTSWALRAIEQMMSKGKVSAEELRQQLGEHLPGAFSLAAKAMGVSTAALNKMLEQGQVMSDDFLPRFAKVLSEKYSGEVAESVRATNKWNEALQDLKVTIAESGFLDRATELIKELTSAIKDPNFQQAMVDFANNMLSVVSSIAELAKYAGLRSVMGTFAEGAKLAADGFLQWDKFVKASFTERQKMVDQAREHISQLKNGIPTVTGKIEKMTESLVGEKGLKPAVQETNKELEKLIETIAKETKQAQQALEDIGKTEYEKEIAKIDRIYEERKKLGADTVSLEIWKLAKLALLNEEYRVKDLEALEKAMEEETEFIEKSEEERQKIIENAQKSKEAIWEKYDEEWRKLVIGEKEFAKQQYEKDLDVYLAVEQAKTGISDEELQKRKLLLMQHYQQANNETDAWKYVWENTLNDMRSEFADFLGDWMTGELDEGENAFEAFCDSLKRMFADLVSELIAYDLFNLIFGSSGNTGVGLFSSGSSGGGLLGALFGSGGGSGSGGSGSNWLGMGSSLLSTGYNAYTGQGLAGSIVNWLQSLFSGAGSSLATSGSGSITGSMFAGMSQAEIAKLLGGSGAGAIGGAAASAGAAYAGNLSMAGFGSGAGMASGAGTGIGASLGTAAQGGIAGIVAAAWAIGAQFLGDWLMKQGEGPSSLNAQLKISLSEKMDALFDIPELMKVYTLEGEWDEDDIKKDAQKLYNKVVEGLYAYELVFQNVSDESKATIKNLMKTEKDFDYFYLQIKQMASDGAPITAIGGGTVLNEFEEGDWDIFTLAVERAKGFTEEPEIYDLQNTIIDAFASDDFREKLTAHMEEFGEVTESEFADLLAVDLGNLERLFLRTGEFADDYLKEFIEKINQYYKYSHTQLTSGTDILTALQNMFGGSIEGFVDEAITNIKASEVYQYMTDEIQARIDSLDFSDFDAFVEIMTEDVGIMAAAASILERLRTIGEGFDYTYSDKLAAMAEAWGGAYQTIMESLTGEEMEEEEITALVKEYYKALADGAEDLDRAVMGITDLDISVAALNGTFDAYIAQLEELGVEIEKITDLEEMRAAAMSKLLDDYKHSLGLIDDDEYYTAMIEKIMETYKDYFGSAEEVIEAFKNASLEDIQAFAEALGLDWTDIANDVGWLVQAINALGSSSAGAASSLSSVADSIKEILDEVRQTISGGGVQTASKIWDHIKEVQTSAISKAFPTDGTEPDFDLAAQDLLTMSQQLASWYETAVSEAEAAAKELADADRADKEAQREILQEELRVAQAFGNLVDQIDSTIQNIKYSTLNVAPPITKAGEAEVDWNELVATAKASGSVEDYQKLTQFAQTALQQYQNEHMSSAAYRTFYAQVMQDLEDAGEYAEAQSYEEAILSELEAIEAAIEAINWENYLEQIETPLSEINAQFEEMATWIEDAMAALQKLEMILTIDWENYDGTMAETLEMLLYLAKTYGWENNITLNWVSDMATWLAKKNDMDAAIWMLEHIADEVGWTNEVTITFVSSFAAGLTDIVTAAGFLDYLVTELGWNHIATITFLGSLNMDVFEDIEQALKALKYVAGSAGWTAKATLKFIYNLASTWDWEGDIEGALAALNFIKQGSGGWYSQAVMSFIAGLVANGTSYDTIADYLEDLGYDPDFVYILRLKAEVEGFSTQDWVDWLGTAMAAGMGFEISALSSMAGHTATALSGFISGNFPNQVSASEVNSWLLANGGWALPYAYGGIATEPTLGVFGEGPYPAEAFVPLPNGTHIPVQFSGGNYSNDRPIEINLQLEIDGQPLDAKIKVIAKNETENVRVNLVRRGQLANPRRQPV